VKKKDNDLHSSFVTKEYLHKELGAFADRISNSVREMAEAITKVRLDSTKTTGLIDEKIRIYDEHKKQSSRSVLSLAVSIAVLLYGALWYSINQVSETNSLKLELALTKQKIEMAERIKSNEIASHRSNKFIDDWYGSAGRSDGVKTRDALQEERIRRLLSEIIKKKKNTNNNGIIKYGSR